jgi:hypothetical protein
MVTPMLRELAGPFPPFDRADEPWVAHERGVRPLKGAWNYACQQAIQTGSAEELHAARDDYQAVLVAYLKILDGYSVLLDRFAGARPDAERITRARDELQTHYDSLFPRWQSLDDLEALLLERISLPHDRLKALAAKSPPAPSWYDEPAAWECAAECSSFQSAG